MLIMRRIIPALAACALSAPALAVFTGIDLREDKGQIPPVELAQIDPLGLGVRVINLYATFDGPGDPDSMTNNRVISVANTDSPPRSWGINKTSARHGEAYFYQDSFGTDRAPAAALVPLFPTVAWDTFVGFSDKTLSAGKDDLMFVDPDFGFVDRDGDGLEDAIVPGWYHLITPPSPRAEAVFNPETGTYDVFLAQLTIIGLDGGADLGQPLFGGPLLEGRTYHWASEVLSGPLTVFTQLPGGGVRAFYFEFAVPAPATSLTILPLFLTLSRRKRIPS